MKITKMIRNKTSIAIAICCLGSLAATNVGQAGLSQLDIGYYTDYSFDVSVQGIVHNGAIASAFSATLTGGEALPNGHPNPFTTFCVDFDPTLYAGNGWWKSGNFNDVALTQDTGVPVRQGVAGLQYAEELYSTYVGGIPAGGWTSAQKQEGAALQLAIWEVLYELPGTGAFNVLSGTGFISNTANSITTRANQMLSILSFGSPNTSLNTTFWNATDASGTARYSQDLIGPFAPVPEPTTIVAGALLLLPFLASTIRRKIKVS